MKRESQNQKLTPSQWEAYEWLLDLNDLQRTQVFELFCVHCGSKFLSCFCMHDE